MMENKDQPAFPVTETANPEESVSFGLSKLEWLAGMALQGILANPNTGVSNYQDPHFGASKEAIMHATELLNQLSTPQP